MKIETVAIFGASGRMGIETVNSLLIKGLKVHVLVRDQSRMHIEDTNLSLTVGDALELNSVDKVISAADAVIVLIGHKPDSPTNLLTNATTNILASMENQGVDRLIVVSSYPMHGSPESMELIKKVVGEEKLPEILSLIEDRKAQEKLVQESNLDWTIIRPAFLTDGPKTNKYQVGNNLPITPDSKISRADVADFITKSLDDSGWSHKKIITIA